MLRLPKFNYYTPRTVLEAARMMADAGPNAMYVAGGTDLYPNMKRQQQRPETVISVMRLGELREIEGDRNSGLRIGAGLLLSEVCNNRLIKEVWPVVAQAAQMISTPLLRNMGTIGGNLLLDTRCNYYNQNYEWRRSIDFCMKKDGDTCWVAPGSHLCWAVQSSDLAPVMLAINAKLKFVSPAGERIIEARALYNHDGINYLNKKPGELLTAIHLPPPGRVRATYHKLRRRGSFDFPVLGVAAALEMKGDGTVGDGRIVLGGVAPAPLDVTAAADQLRGKPLDSDQIQAAAQACFLVPRPLDNTDFLMGWRKQMTRPFVTRALEELRESFSGL
ncbi:MAG: FAD binding domain-containing protein [Acidobacteria bacterium]|nr:FAD binding domain-containing protein [Acidobacteriota bacterium]